MSVVLKVSKPTKNVLTATSLNDFYLHSDYPLLKIHASGTFSFSTAFGQTTINHNLGYKPFVLVFSQFLTMTGGGAESKTAEFYQHDWYIAGASNTWVGRTKVYDNKIVIQVAGPAGGSSLQILGFYYIFKDEI